MRAPFAVLAALLAMIGAARADVVSQAPDGVSVAIYHDGLLSTGQLIRPGQGYWYPDQGLAMVVETREIDLPAGPSQIRFRGVASTIVPQTAAIDGLPQGVLERNFDYDLLGAGSLLAKSIGRTVHLVRTDRKTGRSTDTPAIVRGGGMLEIDGKLEALHCSGLPEHLVFDQMPDGLTDTPTLTVRTDAPVAGHYKIRLSYLATGINWSADYVARVDPGGATLDLSGWLTLSNIGATGFKHAPIIAVAGRYNDTGEDNSIRPHSAGFAPPCWPATINWGTHYISPALTQRLARRGIGMYSSAPVTVLGDREFAINPRALGDYKLYELPEPTDMPGRETKQVQFLALHDVAFTRVYRFRFGSDDYDNADARLVLKLRNDANAGLGKPLPEGNIAVTEQGAGGTPVFLGRSPIQDTPSGLPFEITLGEISSVLVKTHATWTQVLIGGAKHTQLALDFEVIDNRAEPVTFELQQGVSDDPHDIVSESQPHTLENGFPTWTVALEPGEHTHLRFTADRLQPPSNTPSGGR